MILPSQETVTETVKCACPDPEAIATEVTTGFIIPSVRTRSDNSLRYYVFSGPVGGFLLVLLNVPLVVLCIAKLRYVSRKRKINVVNMDDRLCAPNFIISATEVKRRQEEVSGIRYYSEGSQAKGGIITVLADNTVNTALHTDVIVRDGRKTNSTLDAPNVITSATEVKKRQEKVNGIGRRSEAKMGVQCLRMCRFLGNGILQYIFRTF